MSDPAELDIAVTAALTGTPDVGVPEQALPLLTTDEDGQPRAMLLSRAEVAPRLVGYGTEVHCVLRPSTSRSNLLRNGRGTLLVVTPTALHSLRLQVARVIEQGSLRGVALKLAAVKDDSLGIRLDPMRYTPTEELVSLEHWQESSALLHRLANGQEG